LLGTTYAEDRVQAECTSANPAVGYKVSLHNEEQSKSKASIIWQLRARQVNVFFMAVELFVHDGDSLENLVLLGHEPLRCLNQVLDSIFFLERSTKEAVHRRVKKLRIVDRYQSSSAEPD